MNAISEARIRDTARNLLFAPSSMELTKQLPDIGEGIASACAELAKNPTSDGAERLAARLAGVSRFAMELNAALLREAQPQPPQAA